MLLSTTTFICTAATGPKFWFAWSEPGEAVKNWLYGYVEPDQRVSTGQLYLEIYDTESLLRDRVDAIRGESGWYDTCENRIESPPNPNEWECVDGTPEPAVP
jgi:hypothetical protein